jgi:hypothetical protein
MLGAESFEPSAQREPRYKGKHPVAGFFHILFKALGLLLYFTGEWWASYITVFVMVVLTCAFDFWTVKNVTGRVMVALRWWNDIKEDGTNEWVFESGDPNQVDAFDSRFFWWTQMVYTGLWGLFLVTAVLGSWSHIPLVGIALALASANTIGYVKCSKDAKKRVSEWITREAVGVVSRNPEFMAQAAMGALNNAAQVAGMASAPAAGQYAQPQQQQYAQQPQQSQWAAPAPAAPAQPQWAQSSPSPFD